MAEKQAGNESGNRTNSLRINAHVAQRIEHSYVRARKRHWFKSGHELVGKMVRVLTDGQISCLSRPC